MEYFDFQEGSRASSSIDISDIRKSLLNEINHVTVERYITTNDTDPRFNQQGPSSRTFPKYTFSLSKFEGTTSNFIPFGCTEPVEIHKKYNSRVRSVGQETGNIS